MNVQPVGKGLTQCINVGNVSKQAQFDLAVVSGDQLVALVGDKGCTDLSAILGAHRNILQVRIGR